MEQSGSTHADLGGGGEGLNITMGQNLPWKWSYPRAMTYGEGDLIWAGFTAHIGPFIPKWMA